MNKSNIFSIAASVLAIVISFIALGNSQPKFGSYVTGSGITNFDIVDAALGFRVGGVQVITSAGQYNGVINTTGTVTLSGTFNPNSIGSGYLALSGNATTAITATQLCANSLVDFAATVSNASATLPTAAALQGACLNTFGGWRQLTLRNTGVATTTVKLAAGDASTTIKYGYASSSSAQLTVIPGQGDATIDFYYVTSTVSSTNMMEAVVNIFK